MSWYADIQSRLKGDKIQEELEELKPYIEEAEKSALATRKVRLLDENEAEYQKRQNEPLVPDYNLIKREIRKSKLGVKEQSRLEGSLDRIALKVKPRVKIDLLKGDEGKTQPKPKKPRIELLK